VTVSGLSIGLKEAVGVSAGFGVSVTESSLNREVVVKALMDLTD
jgi:hypothetical protein